LHHAWLGLLFDFILFCAAICLGQRGKFCRTPQFIFELRQSLSWLARSIILVAPNAAVFLVHGTGFITPRAPKSSPQLKQNPWFERFTELGQIKNVPMGQNLEGKDHYEDAEGDLEAVHFRGKNPEDSF
jgi:hypothetical protein